MKVLLVKTSSLGDVIHALPAVTEALSRYSDLQLDWLVEEKFRDIPDKHEGVHEVIPVAIRRWRAGWIGACGRQNPACGLSTETAACGIVWIPGE
jgi:heptosyltransferase-1